MATSSHAAPAPGPTVLALAGLVALLLGAITAVPAWAHDSLIASTPEAEEVLEESPEEIVLEFSGDGLTTGETIPNTIWVTDSEGEHWEGETEVDGPTMWTELPNPLPRGEYEVLYNAVYSDGHSEELSFSFTVQGADSADESADEADRDGAAAEEEAAEDAAQETEEADGASDEAPADADGGQTAAQTDGQFPLWAALLIGAGLVGLLAAVLLLVRRRSRQD